MTSAVPIISLKNISKSFGKVHANQDISLDIEAGKILALLGENGAGKSTLMSILAGQLQPDTGSILYHGKAVSFGTTQQAIQTGIGMVYQHFKLVEAMSVAENIFLGSSKVWLKKQFMHEEVDQLARTYGMQVDPEKRVSELSMGEKQQVEILKLLHRKSNILIFDEPTAVLTPKEADSLFVTMQTMTDLGKAIVFISHKLEEVLSVSHHIAILRRGKVVEQMATSTVQSPVELANRMVGREVLLQVNRVPMEPRQLVLTVDKLCFSSLNNVSLEVRHGEILGIIGVAGNGQKPLVEAICGLKTPPAKSIHLLGLEWKKFFATREWQKGLSYIPEDRQGLATCQGLNLLDNFLLTTRAGFVKGPWLLPEKARLKAEKLLQDFDIRPPDLQAYAWQLSGGNLQKMVLAREFYRQPRLIVAEQPTQGLDIAAAEDVWNLLLMAREQAGVLLITGDLSEALALSDRLAVMYNGQIIDTFLSHDREKVEQIPEMMAGLMLS